MLNRASVLVAEDQPFIALDLAFAIEDAGGIVVGPTATCEGALALVGTVTVAAAILDVNLVDGDCSRLVEVLSSLNIPFIIHTAVDLPAALAAQFSGLVVQIKPCPAANLVAQLETLLAERPASYTGKPLAGTAAEHQGDAMGEQV